MQRALRRNRLCLPYGRMVGWNSRHPAARGHIRFVGRAHPGGTFVDQSQGGLPGTMTAAPVTNFDAVIGPALNLNPSGGTVVCSFGSRPATADNSFTVAGIIDGRPTGNFPQCIFGNSANGGGIYLQIESEPIGFVQLSIWGNSDYTSTCPATIDGTVDCGTPYFIGCTVSPTTIDFFSTNLLTGQYYTSRTTTSTAQIAPSGTYYVGNRSSNANQFGAFTTRGGISRVMYSTAHLSIEETIAWCKDPWSFWHPPRRRSIVGITAPPLLLSQPMIFM